MAEENVPGSELQDVEMTDDSERTMGQLPSPEEYKAQIKTAGESDETTPRRGLGTPIILVGILVLAAICIGVGVGVAATGDDSEELVVFIDKVPTPAPHNEWTNPNKILACVDLVSKEENWSDPHVAIQKNVGPVPGVRVDCRSRQQLQSGGREHYPVSRKIRSGGSLLCFGWL